MTTHFVRGENLLHEQERISFKDTKCGFCYGCKISKACLKFKLLLTQSCVKDACKIAVASALLAVLLKVLDHNLQEDFLSQRMPDQIVYSNFTAIMGMLIVFRNVQALGYHKEGASLIYKMTGCWLDAASAVLTFTRNSQAEKTLVNNFRHTLIRLFSLLNMLCLAELEGNSIAQKQAVSFNVIDTYSLDLETLNCIRNSDTKVEVVSDLIQSLIVDGLKRGVVDVPPPLLSRAFQNLSIGMTNFYAACSFAHVGIPLFYVAVTEGLLTVHAIFTPMAMCTFNRGPVEAGIFTFLAVLLPWSLNFLATELCNPFGADENDLPVGQRQYDLNERLQALLEITEHPMPSTNLNVMRAGDSAMIKATTTIQPKQKSRRTLSDFFDRVCVQAEAYQKLNAVNESLDDGAPFRLQHEDSTLSAILSEVASDVVGDEVLVDADRATGSLRPEVASDAVDHERELSNPAANTAWSCDEKVNRIDGPRLPIPVLGKGEELEHENALPPDKNSKTHPPTALTDRPLEKRLSILDWPETQNVEHGTPASTPRALPRTERPSSTPGALPRTHRPHKSEKRLSVDVAGTGQDGQCEASG